MATIYPKNFKPFKDDNKKRLVALNQPFEFVGRVEGYLSREGIAVNSGYLLHTGISAGYIELSHEIRVSDDGAKVDVDVEVTARPVDIGSLVKNIISEFPQFKEKDKVKPDKVRT